MKKIPVDLKYFKKVPSCEGKTREWMANHYLKCLKNNREDVLVLLRLHTGYQAFVVKDESWEPLYNAFRDKKILQIRTIAGGKPVKPQDSFQNLKKCIPLKGQIIDRGRITSNDHVGISWKEIKPYIIKKTDCTAKLDFSVYAVGYKDTKNEDEWSKRFMGFKKNKPKDVAGGQKLLCIITKFLIKEYNLSPNTGILTALPHDKQSADTTSQLFKTANLISKICNIEFLSTSLTKKKHFPLKKQFSYEKREKAIGGCYSCSKLENIENIIILDDFTTTGLTFKEIARAIRETNHNVNLFGVVLAIHPISFERGMNNRIPSLFEHIWS